MPVQRRRNYNRTRQFGFGFFGERGVLAGHIGLFHITRVDGAEA